MFLNPALSSALDRIAERTADVRRAFTPGALPQHDDVATARPVADFTLDPLSVCASDDLYFITRDAEGTAAYTRNGSFTLRDGRLEDAAGNAVCGLSGARLVPMRIDPVDEALGRAGNARIDADGSFAYARTAVDPRSGARESQRVVVGRLALARFPAGTRLKTVDWTHCAAPEGIAPHLGVAGAGDFAELMPMHRERSRIDIDESLLRLKEAYLAFDALTAAEDARVHLGKTTMDLLK